MLQSLKKWCKNSTTIAWGYVQVLGSTIGMGLSGLGAVLTDGDVKSAVQSLGLNPKWLMAFAVAGAVTVFCRMRTVNKPTDENNNVISNTNSGSADSGAINANPVDSHSDIHE